MSSAILYVAIVAIWACVLIPRWLRRDSSASAPVSSPAEAQADDQVTGGTGEEDDEPEPSGRHQDDHAEADAAAEGRSALGEGRSAPGEMRSAPGEKRSARGEKRSAPGEKRSAPGESGDVPPDPGHRRVVSARRRLLLLLLALTIAAGVLAGTRMAVWWVTIPPSVMLIGYLLLLRAAVKADAERRELAYAHAHAHARTAHAAAAAAAAPPAQAAAVLALSGSSAFEGQHDEEIYDQYADAKLRAVGD